MMLSTTSRPSAEATLILTGAGEHAHEPGARVAFAEDQRFRAAPSAVFI